MDTGLGLADLTGTGHNAYCVEYVHTSQWENLAEDFDTVEALQAAERTDAFFQEIERRTREDIHDMCRCDEAFTERERVVR